MQFRGAELAEQRTRLRARLRARVGDLGETLRQRGEIEAGATGQDREAVLPAGLFHGGESLCAPPRRTARLRGGTDAVEAVGHAGFLLRRRAGGQDAHFRIHLHGVGVDDGAAEALGQIEGQRRLAACGGASDENGVGERHAASVWRIGFCRWI